MTFRQFCKAHKVDRWERARLVSYLIALRTSHLLLSQT